MQSSGSSSDSYAASSYPDFCNKLEAYSKNANELDIDDFYKFLFANSVHCVNNQYIGEKLKSIFTKFPKDANAGTVEKIKDIYSTTLPSEESYNEPLPGEVKQMVFSYLDPKDRAHAAQVNREWRGLVGDLLINEINGSPYSLKNIAHITNYEDLKDFVKINGKKLTKLDLAGLIIDDNQLKEIIECCPNLVHLSINSGEITRLPDSLPVKLQTLQCCCPNLVALPVFLAESHLRKLDCSGCYMLAALPDLPARLEWLNCSGCGLIQALPDLPARLERLYCSHSGIRALPAIPASLKMLICRNCESLEMLPDFPPDSHLLHFDCYRCLVLQALPALPASLEELECSHCSLLGVLHDFPPDSRLKRLTCHHCDSFQVLPALPGSLQFLDCRYCPVQVLPAPFPASLECLDCRNCAALRELPTLPKGLKLLLYSNCGQLTKPKKIPHGCSVTK